jgi:hypothetical protein
MKLKFKINKDFPNHAGRPGMVGGSSPKGGSGGDVSAKPSKYNVKMSDPNIHTVIGGTVDVNGSKYHVYNSSLSGYNISADHRNYTSLGRNLDTLEKKITDFHKAHEGKVGVSSPKSGGSITTDPLFSKLAKNGYKRVGDVYIKFSDRTVRVAKKGNSYIVTRLSNRAAHIGAITEKYTNPEKAFMAAEELATDEEDY